jgi:hypothetical protein
MSIEELEQSLIGLFHIVSESVNWTTRRAIYPEGVFLPRSRGLPVFRLPPGPSHATCMRSRPSAHRHSRAHRDRNRWTDESRRLLRDARTYRETTHYLHIRLSDLVNTDARQPKNCQKIPGVGECPAYRPESLRVLDFSLKSLGLQQILWAISRTTGYVFKAWQGKKNAASMVGPDGSGMGETHRLHCILPGETDSGSAGEQPGKG